MIFKTFFYCSIVKYSMHWEKVHKTYWFRLLKYYKATYLPLYYLKCYIFQAGKKKSSKTWSLWTYGKQWGMYKWKYGFGFPYLNSAIVILCSYILLSNRLNYLPVKQPLHGYLRGIFYSRPPPLIKWLYFSTFFHLLQGLTQEKQIDLPIRVGKTQSFVFIKETTAKFNHSSHSHE